MEKTEIFLRDLHASLVKHAGGEFETFDEFCGAAGSKGRKGAFDVAEDMLKKGWIKSDEKN